MPAVTRTVARTVPAILQDAGLVTPEDVDQALARQRENGKRIGETLVEMGVVSEEDLGWALAHQFGLPFVDVPTEALDRDLVRSFREGLLHSLEAVPLVRAERSLSVAVADPTDGDILHTLEQAAGCSVNPSVATRTAIRRALDAILGPVRDTHPRAAHDTGAQRFEVLWDRSGATFLLFHLSRALNERASEIQFVSRPDALHVAYRVGGRLVEVTPEPFEATYSLLERLSSLGGPAIDDRDLHVTGQVLCPHGERELLLDVSMLNHDAGVSVTLGLRHWSERTPSLDRLGIEAVDQARIRAVLEQPSGLVLVTGPVRSGCSTTLAALVAEVAGSERRAIAFETRPGPRIPTATRVAVAAAGARAGWQDAVIAQNADLVALSNVLSGEEITEVLGSAGAGRLLFATTDWSDTFALLECLMGRAFFRARLAARLHLVVNQRLAMRGSPATPVPDGAPPATRCAVFEVLHVTDAMREVLRDGDPSRRLRDLAIADGFRPLGAQLRQLVAAGVITEREAARLLT